MRENGRERYSNYAGLVIFVLIILLVPIVARKYVTLMILIGLYSIVTIGLCLVMG